MCDDRDLQEIEKIRRAVEREHVLVALNKQECGVIHHELLREIRQDVVDIDDRREPEPYLEDDAGDLLQVPDEYMEDRYQKSQGKGKDLLDEIHGRQQEDRLMHRRVRCDQEQHIDRQRDQKRDALRHDDVQRKG